MFRFLRLSFIALLMFACTSAAAFAQSTVSGAIGGIIKDPQGAVVPNATVTARNAETNTEGTATTDSDGRFRIAQLQPGNYTVAANASGFSAFTQEKVVVEVGLVTNLEVPLQVAGVAGVTVQVTSETPVINAERQDFTSNINQTSINELPINGRRANNFAVLAPGVVPDGNFGLLSFRGISGLLNNSTVDGGDNNQAFFSEERGRSRVSYSISQAAVREFQINTSNYSAEYGRAAGGVINTVTKSGTNEFHGGGFYYNRNNKLGARNPRAFRSILNPDFSTSIIGIKPEDVRQQFGGTIGGPIKKDKLFFFFSYDQQRRNFPGLGIFTTPNFLNTVNRPTLISRGLTDTQINSGLGFLNSLTGTVPRRQDQRIFLPKIDYNINSANIFTATFNRLRSTSPAGIQTQATNTRGRASFGDDFVKVDTLTLRLSSTLSPTILNEARFQYSRDNEFQISQPPLPGEPTTAINGSAPDVFLQNGIEFGKPTFLERRAFPDEKRQQYADTVTISRGKQTFKFGGDFNHVNDLLDNLRNESGAFSYTGTNSINDFLIDYTNSLTPFARPVTCVSSTRTSGQCFNSFNQGFGPTAFRFSTNDYNFFAQDDIRVNSKLTVNLGLRYEYEQLPKTIVPNPALSQTGSLPSDKNNFGPRVGFAYSGDQKTVIRGGYGIYYGRIINSTIANALTNTAVPGAQFQVSLSSGVAAQLAQAPRFPNVLPNQVGVPSQVQFFSRNFQAPLIHEADVVVERQLGRNTAISASYLLSYGRNLPFFVDTNIGQTTQLINYNVVGGPFAGQMVSIPTFTGVTPAPTAANPFPNARPNPNFEALTEIRSTVKSQYNAVVLQANRRYSKGLQFQTSYTLAKATDNGQSSATFTNTNDPLDPFNQDRERGRSTFDVRHKFVASAVYTPDFFGKDSESRVGRAVFNGFNIAPIVSFYSGRPYSGTISGSAQRFIGNGGSGVSILTPGTSTIAGGLNATGGSSRFASLPRNSFRQPRIVNVDLRVSRRFRFAESKNIEFLAEAFNLFNRTQVTTVNTVLYTSTAVPTGAATGTLPTLQFNPAFGTTNEAGGTLFRERQVQLAVRFEF